MTPICYLFFYLFIYMWDLFLTELIIKVKPYNNSVEVHPQLSDIGHPVDGACWFTVAHLILARWLIRLSDLFQLPTSSTTTLLNQTAKTQTDQSISWYVPNVCRSIVMFAQSVNDYRLVSVADHFHYNSLKPNCENTNWSIYILVCTQRL
jgi:hypothetical protein